MVLATYTKTTLIECCSVIALHRFLVGRRLHLRSLPPPLSVGLRVRTAGWWEVGDKPSRHRIKKTTRDKVHRFGRDEELEPLLYAGGVCNLSL